MNFAGKSITTTSFNSKFLSENLEFSAFFLHTHTHTHTHTHIPSVISHPPSVFFKRAKEQNIFQITIQKLTHFLEMNQIFVFYPNPKSKTEAYIKQVVPSFLSKAVTCTYNNYSIKHFHHKTGYYTKIKNINAYEAF